MKGTCNNEQLGLTQMQAELSQVAIIKAYTCLPAFIFCVALKWRQPTVLCRAVHFEPGQQMSNADDAFACGRNIKRRAHMHA